MVTDLVQIRQLGEKKRGENERFRRHLKTHDFHERRLRRIAEDIEEQIDCLECANCCKVATVRLQERDVEKLARHLGLQPARFLKDYTVVSEDEGLILRRTEQGCVFLDGKQCLIYDARPQTCTNFPHLVRGNGSLPSRMWEMVDRACYCPIVYNSLEAFKRETGFSMGR
ncbi:MAG: YkgJ family cysteine cluster protein [Bryobacteraceae bacterium]